MKRELDYFMIDGEVGGDQDWMQDPWMNLGGCGALTACDACIYLAGKGFPGLYPFDRDALSRRDYEAFGMKMKPYLSPRHHGIDRLEIFTYGFGRYLEDAGESRIHLRAFSGTNPCAGAAEAVISRIDEGWPVPYLCLDHRDAELDDFIWHWFLLAGYEAEGNELFVKTVTYGEAIWLNLKRLWETGREPRGGMILLH